MKINYNIWNKILDIMALNKWKNIVNNINQEYHNIFLEKNNVLYISRFECHKCSDIFCEKALNFRKNKYKKYFDNKYIFSLKYEKCDICKRKICVKDRRKYGYTNVIYPDYRRKN